MPRVSIGLPIYNGENFAEGAIASLLAQTFSDFELVLVDNASTDRTAEICRAFAARDPRVRYHRNERNIGGAPNFNLAFQLADRAPYYKWAAHDDLHQPEFLAECVKVLDADPGVVLCHTGSEFIDETGRVFRDYDPDLHHTDSPSRATRFRNLLLSDHWAFDGFGLMRREVLAQTELHGGYAGSDRVLLAELGLRGRFHRVPRVLFQSRDFSGRALRSADLRSRAGWFNPKRSGKITLPHWRYFGEYARVVLRVPMPLAERAACWHACLAFLKYNRDDLRDDLRAALQRLTARIRPPGASEAGGA
jgi:glycosyltransferase involved in cell wall biosynthesis